MGARRRPARLVALLALGVLALLGAVRPAAALDGPGERIRRGLEDALGRAVKGRARVGQLTLQPFSGGVEVEDLVLEPGTGAFRRIGIDRGTLRVDLSDLLRGRLRILGITARRLAIDIEPRGGGRPRPRQPFFDVSILRDLEELRVDDGVIHYENRPVRFALDVRGLRIGSDVGAGGVGGSLTAGPVRFTTGDVPTQHIEHLEGRWDWRAPRLHFELTEVRGPAGTFSGNGLVSLTSAGILLRGHLSGTADLVAVLQDENAPVRGRAHAEADFMLADPGGTALAGTLTGVGPLTVAGLQLVDASTRFRLGEHGVELSEGRGRTPGGTRITNFRYTRPPHGRWDVAIDGDANLRDLLDWVKAGRRASQVQGRARFRFEAGGGGPENRPLTWQVRAALDATGVVQGGLAGTAVGAGGPDGGQVTLDGRLDQATLNARFEWPAGGLQAGWRVRAALAAAAGEPARLARRDILRYLEDERIELPQGTLPYPLGPLAIDVAIDGRGSDVLSVDVPFRLDRPTYGTVPLRLLEGRVLVGARGTWEVAFRLAGDDAAGLSGSLRGAAGAPVAIEATARRVPLAVLREYLEGAFDLELPTAEGTLDGAVTGRDAWGERDLQVTATLRGRVAGLPEGDLQLAGRILGDDAHVRVARFSAEGVDAGFTGRVTLPGGLRPWGMTGQVTAHADLRRFGLAAGWPDTGGQVHATGDLAFVGTDRPLVADGVLSWHGFQVGGVALPDGAGRLLPLADGTLFELETGQWNGGARVTGPIGDPAVAIDLAWNDLAVLEFVGALMQRPIALALDMRSDGALHLEGPLRDPVRWHGTARLARLDLLGRSLGGRLEKPVDLDIPGDGRVVIRAGEPLVMLGAAGGRLATEGSVGMFGSEAGTLALALDGTADLNIIEALDPDLVGSGKLTARVAIGGSAGRPRITGQVLIADGRIRLLPYTDAIDALEAQVDFGERLVTFSRGSFRLGGGDVTFLGSLSLDNWRPDRFDVSLRGRDVALNIPSGLWGRYNVDLTVRGPAREPEVAGNVVMLAGRYTSEFDFNPVSLVRVRTVSPETSRSHWTTRVGLRLHVTAADTLAVRNEMAQVQAAANLNLTGDLGQVLLDGTIPILEGGRVRFRGQDYEVVRGTLYFDDPRGEPMRAQIILTTDLRGYAIRLELDATTESLDYQLSSTPALSQQDLLYLLVTGTTPDETIGGQTQTPTELATSYFGTQLGELLLGGAAKRIFGLEQFQIAPSVVGAEARPTARVTVARRINERTRALYSRDLSAEGRDVYRLEYELSRRFRLTAGREALGGLAVDLRTLRRFGEGFRAPVVESTAPILGGTWIRGLPADVDVRAGKDLDLETGERLLRYRVVSAREGVRRKLAEAGFLESNVEDRVEPRKDGRVTLVLDVQPGPRWDIEWLGAPSATRRARQLLAELWSQTQFRPEGYREAVRVVREEFADEGFAAAVVDIRRPDPAARRLVVAVDPGPRGEIRAVTFEGVESLPEEELAQEVLSRPQRVLGQLPGPLATTTVYRPRIVEEDADAIRTVYAQHGYLETEVVPRVRFAAGGEDVRVTFVVREGPLSRIATVRALGDWPGELGPALARITLKAGEPFTPAAARAAESSLRKTLDDAGYWQARVATRPEVQDGRVDVVFHVRAGRAAIVDRVQVLGLEKTQRELIESAIEPRPGDPLRTAALRRTESALFRLGVFRSVSVAAVPVEGEPGRRTVVVTVAENPRLSLLTTFGYDTEERFRASASLSNENLWGLGRTGTAQVFASSLHYGARLTLEDRHLAANRLEGLASLGYESLERGRFVLRTTTAALQIGSPVRLERRWQLRYVIEDVRLGYPEGIDIITDETDIPVDLRQRLGRAVEPIRLGGVEGSFILDRRDDPFLPQRGWLLRADVGLWQRALLSQADFAQLTGQFARYRTRGRLTLAGSVRFGLAEPFGSTADVPIARRFYAGGSHSMRGFERDRVGPLTVSRDPIGGEAMLITNLEARYRVWNKLSMVGFYDVGNVWLKAEDFYSGTLRKAAGLGVRFDTPFGALRLEYGWNLDRLRIPVAGQENTFLSEPTGQFYLSIGEAF